MGLTKAMVAAAVSNVSRPLVKIPASTGEAAGKQCKSLYGYSNENRAYEGALSFDHTKHHPYDKFLENLSGKTLWLVKAALLKVNIAHLRTNVNNMRTAAGRNRNYV